METPCVLPTGGIYQNEACSGSCSSHTPACSCSHSYIAKFWLAAGTDLVMHLLCRWMENIRDWCISRQLWFGHRIPAYYVTLEGELEAKPGGPSERMDRWIIAKSTDEAKAKAAQRFPGQKIDLQQVMRSFFDPRPTGTQPQTSLTVLKHGNSESNKTYMSWCCCGRACHGDLNTADDEQSLMYARPFRACARQQALHDTCNWIAQYPGILAGHSLNA